MSEAAPPLLDHENLGDGTARAVSLDEIDSNARGILDEEVQSAGFDSLEASDVRDLLEQNHPGGNRTIIGTFTRLSDELTEEKETVLIDLGVDGSVTGMGTIQFFRRFVGMPGMVELPFVGYTRTLEEYQGQGFAAARLANMDQVARRIYGQPLHSGTHQEPEVVGMWEKLVAAQKAERLPSDSEFQYRFVP